MNIFNQFYMRKRNQRAYLSVLYREALWNSDFRKHDINKPEIHTGCPSGLVLPQLQQREPAYGGAAAAGPGAAQHRTCLDTPHSECRQQMQKWAVRKQNTKSE